MNKKDKIENAIFSAIDEINESSSIMGRLNKTYETSLFGDSDGLDSLAFVNLIVAIEHNIEDADLEDKDIDLISCPLNKLLNI
tara:strand:+ start:7671 stop:7919 length:249 start_codon:yes stop_codon:yes gene_type:complete